MRPEEALAQVLAAGGLDRSLAGQAAFVGGAGVGDGRLLGAPGNAPRFLPARLASKARVGRWPIDATRWTMDWAVTRRWFDHV
jgi:hypothetical protein